MKHTMNCLHLGLQDKLEEILLVIDNKIGEDRLQFHQVNEMLAAYETLKVQGRVQENQYPNIDRIHQVFSKRLYDSDKEYTHMVNEQVDQLINFVGLDKTEIKIHQK